jgi:aspartyl protease family protein
LIVAALAALLLTPPETPLLGLSHDEFARGAFGSSVLLWLVLSGLVRAGPAGAARVLSSVALWAVLAAALLTVYAYRFELGDVADRVFGELSPSTVRVGPSGEVVVRRRYGGEFVVPAKVNGRSVEFVFDTGASSVVLSAEDAARAGLSLDGLDFEAPVTTANGETTAAPVRIDKIAIGPILVRDVRALVARPGALSESLLGMSFLERLDSFAVERGKLVLKGR